MIKHVVCFKLKEKNDAVIKKTKDLLLSMKENVPTVREIEVGNDFLASARSFDIYLGVVLDSRDVLDEYQNDPYHVNVVKKHMHSVSEQSISVDFDI